MYRIRFEGSAGLAVSVATAVADAEGIELISSEPLSIVDQNTVGLEISVEGERDAVVEAVAAIRNGMSKGSSIEIVDD